jgi:hypothetical protein
MYSDRDVEFAKGLGEFHIYLSQLQSQLSTSKARI